MPLDLNEVSGFISHTDNKGYLLDLFNHVGRRLNDLGVPVPLWEPQPLAEGPARSPALAEDPGPDLWPVQPQASSLSEEEDLGVAPPLPVPPPSGESPLRPVDDVPLPPTGPAMPDYSKFPEGLREKLEMAWKERNGVS
jgi:hypothetical protein